MPVIITTDGKLTPYNLPDGEKSALESLQGIVGGYIQVLPLSDGQILVINEEGKLEGLEINLTATQLAKDVLAEDDFIVGDCILMKEDELE